MTDHITPEHRSWNMSRIRGKDTEIEIKVRRWLFSKGFRFRKNDKRYPGKPDIVLPKYRTVVFINGCFWHRHEGCKYATMPKTRTEYWKEKFERNVANDRLHRSQLEQMGWNVITVWECELKADKFSKTLDRIERQILDGGRK
ncbi:MAG: very short patch repair endonuclease [Anaerovoracaceae bacterium]